MKMGLVLRGELLAVTIETRVNRQDNTTYESRVLTVFDGRDAIRVSARKDFPIGELVGLRDVVDQRPRVELGVALFNGKLYLDVIEGAELPAPASGK